MNKSEFKQFIGFTKEPEDGYLVVSTKNSRADLVDRDFNHIIVYGSKKHNGVYTYPADMVTNFGVVRKRKGVFYRVPLTVCTYRTLESIKPTPCGNWILEQVTKLYHQTTAPHQTATDVSSNEVNIKTLHRGIVYSTVQNASAEE